MQTQCLSILTFLIVLSLSTSQYVDNTTHNNSNCLNSWSSTQYAANTSYCSNLCFQSKECMMISYSNNNSKCYLFNNICTVSSQHSSFIWYKNTTQSFKSSSNPITNMSKLIFTNSPQILAVRIKDIWYIPVIIFLCIIICWICCWIVILKVRARYFNNNNTYKQANAEIENIELEEFNIDNQRIIDPAKIKNGNKIKKANSRHGALIYQKRYFNAQQLKFVSEMNIKCQILFGDNDQDKNRKFGTVRKHFGGQAGIVGKYDRNIGYGIITTFFKRKYVPKAEYFSKLMDIQFEPLKKYIVSGYDIIIPYPTKQDVKKRYQMYYGDDGSGVNKQIIFHNLGTGIAQLSFENIYYIQKKILELQSYAKCIRVVNYYGYNPKINQNECPLCNEMKMFLIKFTNCRHKLCEECLKQYIDENLNAYNNNNIDVKFECWAVKLNKCNNQLCLNDINYPPQANLFIQKNQNGTILDNKKYKIFKDIMKVYDKNIYKWEKDICPNENCLKPFKIHNNWNENDQKMDNFNSNSDTSDTLVIGKIFHCTCCGDEIHGEKYNDNDNDNNSYSSYEDDDLLEEKYNHNNNIHFNMFYCNICDKKFCNKCHEYCFYDIKIAIKNNIKTPKQISIKLNNINELYTNNELFDCCEICWFKYYCRYCPYCKYKFCGVCHGEWNGVTVISKKQKIIYKKFKSKKKNNKNIWFIKGGKEIHNISTHHSCKKIIKKRLKSNENKLYENQIKNEEIKILKIKLENEKYKNEKYKNKISELEEKKEFDFQKQNDIYKIEKKIEKISKKMKKINKEAIWEWKESKNVWRLYDNKTIKQIEKLKINEFFEYTLLANNQKYTIKKLSKKKGEQININTNVCRNIRRSERDKNSEIVKYPSFWPQISKNGGLSYAKAHFSKLKYINYELYNNICNKFYLTVLNNNSITITDIETVENRFLFDKYHHSKNAMIKLIGENNINERELWHGTKYEIIDVICTEGFRKEFNTAHAYGEGTYFARDANYSVGYAKPKNNYNNNKYRMFLCKVLTGQSAKGTNDIKLQNWPKNNLNNDLIYDSLVDNIRNPSIYVIHDDIRAYPMYIIHFKKF